MSGAPAQALARRGYPPLFAHSLRVSHAGFDFELVAEDAGADPELLGLIRDDVIELAARSRGWEAAEDIEHFRRVFKLESLYSADALALVWRGEQLVGLAGMVHSLPAREGSVLHLGSLGLLPAAQRRGILPTLFSLLWEVVLDIPRLRDDHRRGRLFLTGITQSPFIVAFYAAVTDLHPAPDGSRPDQLSTEIAELVVKHFDPQVAFDPSTFVLAEECDFFYRRIPYSTDRAVNRLCDNRLRYAAGDTFVLVGRARAETITAFTESCARTFPALYHTLWDALRTRKEIRR